MKKDKEIEMLNENDVTEEKEVAKKAPKITKVGAMLKEMRLQKGLKIVDVSRKLCIRKCYLEAIEESNYKEIPLFPYGIGFIRSYAKFLGLNDQNIVDLYKEETQSRSSNDIKELTPQTEASIPGMQYLVISLLAIALIYAGWMFMNDDDSNVNVENAPSEQTQQVGDEQLIITEEIDIEQTANETATSAEGEEQIVVSDEVYVDENEKTQQNENAAIAAPEVKDETPIEKKTSITIPDEGVFIEVLKETWVEVKDESKLYLSKVLAPNSTYTVSDAKGKILSVGKHDGVNVYINGKKTSIFTINKKTNVALDKFLNNL